MIESLKYRLRRGVCPISARLCAIFIMIALLPGAVHAASVEGYWYGDGYQPLARKTMQWLAIKRPDGSFSVEFREYKDCELMSAQQEAGSWSVAGDIITEKTLTVNGRPVEDIDYYTDSFNIIELTAYKLRLAHEKTGQEWTLTRVTEDFDFPDCKFVG